MMRHRGGATDIFLLFAVFCCGPFCPTRSVQRISSASLLRGHHEENKLALIEH
jgi:hypothetical protein